MRVAPVALNTTRTDYLGPYGGDASTPTLDALACQSTTFRNCSFGAPWAPANHATMFSGQYLSKHNLRADNVSYPVSGHWLPETLRDISLTTRKIGAEPWLSRWQGFDRFHDTGFHDWKKHFPLLPAGLGYARPKLGCAFGEDDGSDRLDLHLFRQWADTTDPFTLLNISVVHSSYHPPKQFFGDADVAVKPQSDFVFNQPFYPVIADETEPRKAEWAAVRRYAAGISHADYLLEKAVEVLDDGVWLFVTADHDELLGDGGLAVHHFSLHDELPNVLLLVSHPSLESRTVDGLVHHIDLALIICDIAEREGYDAGDVAADLPGRSLLSAAKKETAQRGRNERIVFSEYGPPVVVANSLRNNMAVTDSRAVEQFFVGIQAAITNSFKLLRREGGMERLVRRDDETTDVKEAFTEMRCRLSETLDGELGPFPSVKSTELDSYVDSDVQDSLEHSATRDGQVQRHEPTPISS